jgi:hypothetical protein
MDTQVTVVFFFQVAFTLAVMSLVARYWVIPRLRALPDNEALALLLLPGALRYMGSIILVPAMAPGVPADMQGVVGDVLSAVIAVAGIIANRASSPAGRPLAWLYVAVGGADLVVTFLKGLSTGLWTHLAGGWTFVVMIFPAVVIGLVLTPMFLLRRSPTTHTAGTARLANQP